MSERVARDLVERINTDPGFAALLASDPEAALGGHDLTDAERRRLLDLGADVAGGVERLETRVSRSSLVFGSLGHGAAHDSLPGAHAHLPGAHTPAPLPDISPGDSANAAPADAGVNIYEGAPVGSGGWHLPPPDTAHAPSDMWPSHPAAHIDAAVMAPAGTGVDPTAHQGWDSAWTQPGGAQAHGSGIWQLPGSASDSAAPSADQPIDGIGQEVERIPGLGQLFSAGEALASRGHSVPGDVVDTFTSLGGSVVSSMETAVTTSIMDGIGAGEQVIHRLSAIRW